MSIKSTSNFEKLKAAKKPAAKAAPAAEQKEETGYAVSTSEIEAALLSRKPKDVVMTMRVPDDFISRIDAFISSKTNTEAKGQRTKFIQSVVESYLKNQGF